MVICACLAGMASSVRELVKERSILNRERAAGLSSGAYLISKLLVLGVISIGQSTVLVLIGVSWRPIHHPGAFFTAVPLFELILGIAVLAVASMCLGPVRVRHRQHVGEGDALPGAVHHGPGGPVRLRGTAGQQPGTLSSSR